MSKHTPAPWQVLHAKTFNKVSSFDVKQNDISEAEHNAILIAAAPDLLAALIACDDAMDYISEYDIPLTLPQQVKDAIEKATK